MANTVIQIKRSNATATPANGSLSAAEPAYSYLSGKLFLGNTSGNGVVEVGGQYWTDLTSQAFAQANAAFEAANTGNNAAVFTQANAAFDQANTARTHANTAHETANASFVHANAAFEQANTSYTHANVAHSTANAGFVQANTARTHANTAHETANASFIHANAAFTQANDAYSFANTRFSANGGTIDGSVTITGTLFLTGNTIFANTETLRISDPLLYLAGNNYTTDAVDIGFIANYVNATGSNVHTGLYREHTSKEYYLFYGYDQEADGNHIDPTANGFTIAVLNADLITSNLKLGGVNAISWITDTFVHANAAFTHANVSFVHANAAYKTANAGFVQANTARTHANTAHETANASYAFANSAHSVANAAFDFANTANVNAANASYLSTGTVPSGRISGSYTGITGIGIISAGTWNASTIDVLYGGTGMTSFTQNGVLYGNTTGPIKVTAAGTEGQVLTATAAGAPAFSHLDGGSF
jgi:hypothetical protein